MEKFNAFLSAVDIVCGDCHYCDEAHCEKCPVRFTVQDKWELQKNGELE